MSPTILSPSCLEKSQKEDVDDEDEELGDVEERKTKKDIIPCLFANSRNQPEKSMLSYN